MDLAMMDIFNLLEQLEISYQRFDHPPIYTCEQANHLGLNIGGAKTKNLFLRDAKGKRHFLYVTCDDKSVDLKRLAQQLGVNRLSFASPNRLEQYLSTSPGCVSILDITKDKQNQVELIVDQLIWEEKSMQCHPFINTSTLVIQLSDIQKLMKHLNRSVTLFKS